MSNKQNRRETLNNALGNISDNFIRESMDPRLLTSDKKINNHTSVRKTAIALASVLLTVAIIISAVALSKRLFSDYNANNDIAEAELQFTNIGGEYMISGLYNPSGAEKIRVTVPSEFIPTDMEENAKALPVTAYNPENIRYLAPRMMTLEDGTELFNKIAEAINNSSKSKKLTEIDWKKTEINQLISASGNEEWADYIKLKSLYLVKAPLTVSNTNYAKLISFIYPQTNNVETSAILIAEGVFESILKGIDNGVKLAEIETIITKWLPEYGYTDCLESENKVEFDSWSVYVKKQNINSYNESPYADYQEEWENAKADIKNDENYGKTPVFRYQIVEISLSESISNISENALDNTGIKEFDIPESVKIIHSSLFANCKFLEQISLNNQKFRIEKSDGYIIAEGDNAVKYLLEASQNISVSDILVSVYPLDSDNNYIGNKTEWYLKVDNISFNLKEGYFKSAEKNEFLSIWRKYDSQKQNINYDTVSDVTLFPNGYDGNIFILINTSNGIVQCYNTESKLWETVTFSDEDMRKLNNILNGITLNDSTK